MKPTRLRHLAVSALLFGASCASPAPAPAPQSEPATLPYGLEPTLEERSVVGNFEALVGTRQLEDSEGWDPLDDPFEFGIGFQVPLLGERSEARLDLADLVDWDFGLRYAFDDSTASGASIGVPSQEVESDIWDASIGLLLTSGREDAWIRPYIGGGAALVYTEVEFLQPWGLASDNSTLFTGYVRGGARIRFRPGQYFGIDLRWLFGGDDDVDGIDASAEALSIAFLFGARL